MPDTDLKTIDKIIEKLGELPAAPIILSKVLKLTSDLRSNIYDISKYISADQALTAKVIHLSNSPIYGRIFAISSLNEAIKVLGFNQVKSIIITASAFRIFQSVEQASIAHILWGHSLATALAARLIVEKYGMLDKEEAYLCGLLHDIGKLVLLQSIPHCYSDIVEKVKEGDLSFIQAEGKELGFNHVNVGHELLKIWKFPTNLVSQISAHHTTKVNQKEYSMNLARVTAIANSIAKQIGAGFFEAYEAPNNSVIFIGNKFIEVDDLISLRNDTETHFNSEMDSFYR